jgi:hypothetical protein
MEREKLTHAQKGLLNKCPKDWTVLPVGCTNKTLLVLEKNKCVETRVSKHNLPELSRWEWRIAPGYSKKYKLPTKMKTDVYPSHHADVSSVACTIIKLPNLKRMTISTQEKILLTSSRLFYNSGIRATGIDTIIKEAGVSKMSLYKYFASKNDLIIAYLLREEKIMMERYEKIIFNINSPKDKLLAIFDINHELMESVE